MVPGLFIFRPILSLVGEKSRLSAGGGSERSGGPRVRGTRRPQVPLASSSFSGGERESAFNQSHQGAPGQSVRQANTNPLTKVDARKRDLSKVCVGAPVAAATCTLCKVLMTAHGHRFFCRLRVPSRRRAQMGLISGAVTGLVSDRDLSATPSRYQSAIARFGAWRAESNATALHRRDMRGWPRNRVLSSRREPNRLSGLAALSERITIIQSFLSPTPCPSASQAVNELGRAQELRPASGQQ